MAHYVVGDVQGCFKELEALLKKIKFNFNKDILVFAGDLVNRGDASEKVLEFCIKNKESVKAVLGNHDFYLLYLIEHQKKDKSLKKVLESKNVKKYQAWLKKQPLLLDIKIKKSNEIFWISHAGIPFIWQADKAKKFSKEIQVALKNDSSNLLKNIWGDNPKIWNPNLRGYKRQRTIINYFTRMRFLSKDGSLRLNLKSGKGKKGYIPWYKQTIDNLKDNENIVFGHWASLEGKTGLKNIIGLDTGCVWGNKLTAIRLEDRKLFQIKKKMKIYEVGGAVRDTLLGKIAKDRDWVVVGSSPEEMVSNGFKPIGKDFPVFLHPSSNEEYALARTEKKTGHGYHGFNFYFGKDVTLEEDLSRRDLTINAIARDSSGNIIDPYEGIKDLERKIFRHVSDAFLEDPLRAIRLARFHTYEHLKDFSIDSKTEEMLEKIVNSEELANLSPDRIWTETDRAMSSKNPNIFFELIIKYKMHHPYFEELRKSLCDTTTNSIIRWAELQANNDFALGNNLPIPNAQKNASDVLMKLMKISKDMPRNELIKLFPLINFDRNELLIKDLCSLPQLSNSKELIFKLVSKTMETDFSFLKNIPNEKIHAEKHKIYEKILNQCL